jgi:hypothetical protein
VPQRCIDHLTLRLQADDSHIERNIHAVLGSVDLRADQTTVFISRVPM